MLLEIATTHKPPRHRPALSAAQKTGARRRPRHAIRPHTSVLYRSKRNPLRIRANARCQPPSRSFAAVAVPKPAFATSTSRLPLCSVVLPVSGAGQSLAHGLGRTRSGESATGGSHDPTRSDGDTAARTRRVQPRPSIVRAGGYTVGIEEIPWMRVHPPPRVSVPTSRRDSPPTAGCRIRCRIFMC
jgi:hypothetical protein